MYDSCVIVHCNFHALKLEPFYCLDQHQKCFKQQKTISECFTESHRLQNSRELWFPVLEMIKNLNKLSDLNCFLDALEKHICLHMITFPLSLSVDVHQIWESPSYWSFFSSFSFLVRQQIVTLLNIENKIFVQYFKITHFKTLYRLHTVHLAVKMLMHVHAWVININMQWPNIVLQEYGTGSRLPLVLLLMRLFPRLRLLNTQIDLWKKPLWVDCLQVN